MSIDERMKMALFRFGVIAPLVCRRLEKAERQGVRYQIGEQLYEWPNGRVKQVALS